MCYQQKQVMGDKQRQNPFRKKSPTFAIATLLGGMVGSVAIANDLGAVAQNLKDRAASLATGMAEEGLESMLERTEISIDGLENRKPTFSILTVQPLHESTDLQETTFFQGSLFAHDSRETINLGLGYRRLSDDELWLAGINAFYDQEFPYNHKRASIGAELRSTLVEIIANRYFALTDALTGENSVSEQALGGYEFELGAQLPYVPGARIFAKQFRWKGENGGADLRGKTYSLNLNKEVLPNVTLEAGVHDYDGAAQDQTFMTLTYHFDKPVTYATPLFSRQAFTGMQSMKERRLDKVRRTNTIVKQRGGFTVSIR